MKYLRGNYSKDCICFLIFYYGVANYYRYNGLKQYIFVIFDLLWIRNPGLVYLVSLLGITSLYSTCDWVASSSRGSIGEDPSSILIHVVGRIHFLVVVWLKVQAFCWLSAGSCPQVLDVNHSSQRTILNCLPSRIPKQTAQFIKSARIISEYRERPDPLLKGFHLSHAHLG